MRRILIPALAMVAALAGCGPGAPAELPRAGTLEAFMRLGRAGAKEPVRFVVLGDSQFMDDESFERVLGETRLLSPDLVLQVGDLVLVTERDAPTEIARQWCKHWGSVRRAGAPFFPVPGNHDVAGPRTAAAWERIWGPLYYSFDYGNCHFVVLNSEAGIESAWAAWTPHAYAFDFGRRRILTRRWRYGRSAATAFGREQDAWLAWDLASTEAEHVFVFLHKPFWLDEGSWREWEPYHDLFQRSRVRAVFAGHIHRYSYARRDGIDYIVTIASKAGPEHVESGRFAHLVRVDVAEEVIRARIQWRGRDLALDAVDPAVQCAHRIRWAKLPKVKVPARRGGHLFALRNPTSRPVRIAYAWEASERSPLRLAPASGETELAPGEERKFVFLANPREAPLPKAPRLVLDVEMELAGDRRARAQRHFTLPLELDFAGVPLRRRLPGRVVLVGKGKGRSIAWLLDKYDLKKRKDYLEASSAAKLDALWPGLRPGDTLVTSHLAFEAQPKLARWFAAHRGELHGFLEAGGRLVACLGHRENERPLLADYGVRYRRHDRAWKTDRKGDNELLLLAPSLERNPLARGVLGGRLRYRRVPMLDGDYVLDRPREFAILATDSTGAPAVVAKRVGKGLATFSAARLNSHHHMETSYNQGRIWPNLLTLEPVEVARLAGR